MSEMNTIQLNQQIREKRKSLQKDSNSIVSKTKIGGNDCSSCGAACASGCNNACSAAYVNFKE